MPSLADSLTLAFYLVFLNIAHIERSCESDALYHRCNISLGAVSLLSRCVKFATLRTPNVRAVVDAAAVAIVLPLMRMSCAQWSIW